LTLKKQSLIDVVIEITTLTYQSLVAQRHPFTYIKNPAPIIVYESKKFNYAT